MSISWNIVNKTGADLDVVSEKIYARVSKLEALLSHFPGESLHLQLTLEVSRRSKAYVVSLHLRVPSDVIQVRKTAKSLAGALDDAVSTLLRRLDRRKARFRREYAWRHGSQRILPDSGLAFAARPLAEGAKPQTLRDMVKEVLMDDYDRLLGFVTRQVDEQVLAGNLPENHLDPRDIVNRVAEEVLSQPERKPESMDFHGWCLALAFRETSAAVERYRAESQQLLPVDLDAASELDTPFEDEGETEADGPQVAHPPEERALLETLRNLVRSWPREEREIFGMHYLEGLSAQDITHAYDCEPEEIDERLRQVGERFRRQLFDATRDDEEAASADQHAAWADHLSRTADSQDD